MNKNKLSGILSALAAILLSDINGYAQTKQAGDLLREFVQPPASALPRVWWHWMNGNISKEGIRKDLEWMKRSGIGGFQNFDAGMVTPQIVDRRLTYMTPEWQDAFLFTTRLADSLKLEMAIAGSPGWSESGGPWVPPSDGMKKIVWSETDLAGGATFTGQLPKPPVVTGVFQNLPIQAEFGMGEAPKLPILYGDIAVIAYRVPAAEKKLADLNPVISSSGGHFSLSQLTDGDLIQTSMLPSDTVKGYAWIQFAFETPQTIRAVTMVGGGDKGPFGLFGEFKDTRSVEVSDDGDQFRWICFLPAGNLLQQTIAIPPTTARYFRVTVKNPPPAFSFASMMGGGDEPPKPPPGTGIAELVLHTNTRIDRFEEKAAFAAATDLSVSSTPPAAGAIAEADLIDLTGKMNADGSLNWTAPAGNWKLLRFGYTLTGKQNHPASPEATGLEVDKLDPVAVKAYFENYLDQYKSATGGLMGEKGGLQYIITDSWEAGVQNWTGNLFREFETRRGYSMLKWMPVLTGKIIHSSEKSEQFLWDFRKTLGEMVVEYHYDQLTELLAKRGMKRYSESHESGRVLIGDGMEVKRTAAIPMAAMWTPGPVGGDGTGYKADIRESASVAHIYGQNLVAAESMTSAVNAWAYSPERLKPTADLELASGLNRFVIHTSVHQPSDEKIPGLGLGPFGQWFTRHETWAHQAKAWTSYLARSSYMLQQGKFVADIIYYYGEDNNVTSLFGKKLPAIPAGYNYDFVNTDALLRLVSVRNGQLVTASGMQYRLLVLDSNSRQMTLSVARKLRDLVQAGATILGPRPAGNPSLLDDQKEWQSIIRELWGEEGAVRKIGTGSSYTGSGILAVLTAMDIRKDFDYNKSFADTELLFVHRKTEKEDIYWINNRRNRKENLEGIFRVSGKEAEIWHPETGKISTASYTMEADRTRVKLSLEPEDAFFVVFRKKAVKKSNILPAQTEINLATIEGEWQISFQPDRGAPDTAVLDQLRSWTTHSDAGIKYFSGTGTYVKTINATGVWFAKGARILIDLGEVKNMAEVFVNGKPAGLTWKQPFRVDITDQLKLGQNQLEIRVTNLWVNRLIGDQQPGVQKKITYTTMPFYQAGSPLLPSGLMGPVQIISRKN